MSDDRTVHGHHILNTEPEVLRPHVEVNAGQVDAVLARNNRRSRFMRRLFPDDTAQVVYEHQLEQVKTGFEYRRRALHMAVETRLQAIEELCNHVLVTGKSEIRRQRQEFFADQMLKLQRVMDECAEQFHLQTERRFERLEQYRNEHLRLKEEERLMRSVDQFHAMLEELGREFMEIIHEGVKR